ncbi:MAG: GNAT family N-acetyltransferase [Sphaerospermopsis sp.]|nr:GNAT family N-acetyltransferase [Sphaerospermopsis sp.]
MIQTQNIKGLIFREADNSNIREIVDLHNSNVLGENGTNDNGFLLAKISEEEVLKNLNNSTQYFIAVNDSDEVVGYLSVSRPKITDDFLNQIVWEDNDSKNKIINHQEQHLYIQVLATKQEYMGKGIAQFMYKSLYEKFPQTLFSSFIVTKPIFNQRSLIFHEKQDFKHIGTFQSPQLMDLQNYESILMFKDI